ncbi:J domain-containing protein [Inhella gelatinilytica]|uniref:J domain-containing protein n=1 Tax=Inhella gelatinilytica TaxID=2795030 RepID=A0A931ITK0_9BURK|nr:J domain-containing protein [Inhella gelatinilytica]MBH9552475.1 J domain-containing protein [Inhella gelatinilytica]
MNHYDTLEVSPKASPAVLRAAYRSLMQRHHPDRHGGEPTATARAAAIAAAYEVLSDPIRRAAYDQTLLNDRSLPPAVSSASPVTPNRIREPVSPRIARSGWWWALPVGAALVGWAVSNWGPAPDPVDAWLALRQELSASGLSETRRKALLARKAELLRASPTLQGRAEHEARRDREQRTLDLLLTPLVVRGPSGTLTLPRIQVVLGSFDTPGLRTHLAQHRTDIVTAVHQALSAVDTGQEATGPSEALLKARIHQALERALGTQPQATYPDTWFESPGRYGVIDVLLPEVPRFVPRAG